MIPIEELLAKANDSTLDGFYCSIRKFSNSLTARFYWREGITSRSFEIVFKTGEDIHIGAFERGVREIIKTK